jgi:hypothetical protein
MTIAMLRIYSKTGQKSNPSATAWALCYTNDAALHVRKQSAKHVKSPLDNLRAPSAYLVLLAV